MSDRFYDRHDNSYDSYEDEYEDRYYGSRLSRSSYSDSRSARRNSSEVPRSGRSFGTAGRSYRDSGDYRLSQSSDARYPSTSSGTSNMFDDYYSDEKIDAYRRSAYGTGSAYSRRSSRRSSQGFDDSASSSRRRSAQRGASSSRRPASAPENRDAAYSRSPRPSSHGASQVMGRDVEAAGYAPKRSNRRRNLIIAGVVAVVIVLMGVGMAFAYVNSISDNLHEGVDDDLKNALVQTDMANEPFYLLLLGTDTGEWRLREQTGIADTVRSDSMMLARIDPVSKKVTLISIARDTMVDLDEYGEQKINAAYQMGGAAAAVKAVSKLTGLNISHYASVDFDGFSAVVDALGGVEVDVPTAIDDPDAGGSVEAGLQTLNGAQALILCRARHAYDDMETVGGYIRDGYQRIVLSAIAKKILASDILTIANTVRDVSYYVTTDLELADVIGLAQIMQGLDPDTDIYSAAMPTEGVYLDGTWYEVLDEDEWTKMISRMKQGLPPSEEFIVDEATGVVLATTGDKSAAENASGNYTGRRATSTFVSDDEWYWDDGSDDYWDDEEYWDDESGDYSDDEG